MPLLYFHGVMPVVCSMFTWDSAECTSQKWLVTFFQPIAVTNTTSVSPLGGWSMAWLSSVIVKYDSGQATQAESSYGICMCESWDSRMYDSKDVLIFTTSDFELLLQVWQCWARR